MCLLFVIYYLLLVLFFCISVSFLCVYMFLDHSVIHVRFMSHADQVHSGENELSVLLCVGVYKPRCEKTGLRGFRPGPT